MSWKKFFVPGLSGAAVGFLAMLARARRRRGSIQFQPVSDDGRGLVVTTQEATRRYQGDNYLSESTYTCEPTQFKVWSFLDSRESEDAAAPSHRIYHVTPVIVFRSRDGAQHETVEQERFYATIHAVSGNVTRPDMVAVGALLEFHKCHVGGSMNGIETGEKVVSSAALASVTFT